MSYPDNFSDGAFEAVVAAATYAVNSLEDKASRKQRGSVEFSEDPLPKSKSRNEDTNIKLTSFGGSFKRRFTDQEATEGGHPAGDSSAWKSEKAQEINLEDWSADQRITEKEMDMTTGSKPTPMFTANSLNDTGVRRFESGKEMRPGAQKSPAIRYPTTSFGNRTQYEAEADAWEKARMIKIKKRYDKMMSMIMEWENEKKAKAKSRLQRKQNEPEDRRKRALRKYEEEISEYEKVAGEARALAEERKRNNETKARAKAAKIRSTGKIPHPCCYC